jgi:hypothetical protein
MPEHHSTPVRQEVAGVMAGYRVVMGDRVETVAGVVAMAVAVAEINSA